MSDTEPVEEFASTGLEHFIDGNTVGLLYLPPDYAAPRQGWSGIWRRHVVANAAVRDREYMEALFCDHFPTGRLSIVDSERIPAGALNEGQNIVLLYPDAIGIDWHRIERAVFSSGQFKRVLTLNGRRRLLQLDSVMRRRLAWRRFLEKSRLPEFAFLLLFLVATPALALFDLLRGRR